MRATRGLPKVISGSGSKRQGAFCIPSQRVWLASPCASPCAIQFKLHFDLICVASPPLQDYVSRITMILLLLGAMGAMRVTESSRSFHKLVLSESGCSGTYAHCPCPATNYKQHTHHGTPVPVRCRLKALVPSPIECYSRGVYFKLRL